MRPSRQRSSQALRVRARAGSAAEASRSCTWPRSSTTHLVDFREIAPRAIDVAAFERRPFPDAERGKLVGVPGEPAGLHELHRRFGKRAWRDLVAPAERVARNGFVVEAHLAEVLTGPSSFGSSAQLLKRDRVLSPVYFPGGKPALAGQRLTNQKLARTLATTQKRGASRAIYEGEIADDLVASTRALGGALALEDLAAYKVRDRTPLVARWEGFEVVTMPPPSAGGLLLAQVLGLFTRNELETTGFEKPLGVHLLAEAMRGASADRACCVGDPDFVAVDVAEAPRARTSRTAKTAAVGRSDAPRRALHRKPARHAPPRDGRSRGQRRVAHDHRQFVVRRGRGCRKERHRAQRRARGFHLEHRRGEARRHEQSERSAPGRRNPFRA